MNITLEKDQTVYLKWLDSTNLSGGWLYEDLTAHAKEIETIGFVVDATEKAVMIVSTKSPTGGIVNPITIPLGCIEEVIVLNIRELNKAA